MRIQLASDLHLEFLRGYFRGERLIAPAHQADVLVLAGDIEKGTAGVELFSDWPTPVLYVLGNHEFYGRDLDRVRADVQSAARGTSVRILDNEVVDFGGVRFISTTLWTDYRVDQRYEQSIAIAQADRALNDHRLIRRGDGRFSAQQALEEHNEARRWLELELDKPYDGKTVVVSHHAPHQRSIHRRFEGSMLNGAFVSQMPELVNKADFWLHGHVHNSFDYRVGRCRVVANPLGYPIDVNVRTVRDVKFENAQFGWACILDVYGTA